MNTTDPETGQPARRETNTMPQWAGSCWYYLRFISPHLETAAWDSEDEKYWMPVDLYVGGEEHAELLHFGERREVGHLGTGKKQHLEIRKIGKRRLTLLEPAAVTSAARFENDGYLLRAIRNYLVLGLYFLGVPPTALRRLYG